MKKTNKRKFFNAFVVLFSLLLAVNAYAAPSMEYKHARMIETRTRPVTMTENLQGVWWDANLENNTAIYISFEDDVMSVGRIDEAGNNYAIVGQYAVVGGHEITTEYIAANENGNLVMLADSEGKGCVMTHYIGFFDDDTCVFSLDGKENSAILKRME